MKLNLGSNKQIFAGFSNVDHRSVKGVDIVDDRFVINKLS